MKLAKTKKFLDDHCYHTLPQMIDDCQPVGCRFCGKTAFSIEGIQHTRNCELAAVLKELENK